MSIIDRFIVIVASSSRVSRFLAGEVFRLELFEFRAELIVLVLLLLRPRGFSECSGVGQRLLAFVYRDLGFGDLALQVLERKTTERTQIRVVTIGRLGLRI